MTLLTCNDLCLRYEGRPVVQDLSFTVEAGDFLCVVGENGSGKSTLIKSLLGLHAPAAGTISFAPELAPNQVGYLPQQTELQKDFPATVFEVALSGRINRRAHRFFYTAAEKAQTHTLLQRVGMDELSGRCFRELSGGQQQRVLLVRAMNAAGKLLFLDEPVNGLDPVAARELYDEIAARHKQGLSVIMVTHDVAAALELADHVLHLGHDSAFFGTVEDYSASPMAAGFLGGVR